MAYLFLSPSILSFSIQVRYINGLRRIFNSVTPRSNPQYLLLPRVVLMECLVQPQFTYIKLYLIINQLDTTFSPRPLVQHYLLSLPSGPLPATYD